MSDQWTFEAPKDSTSTYADGTVVPGRTWRVRLNGVLVGECDVHLHKRRGPDGRLDLSWGFTGVTYSVDPAGGK